MRIPFVLALTACGSSPSAALPDAPAHVPGADAVAVDARAPQSIDCTAQDPACPTLAIAGDAAQSSLFHGLADPSMRRDPVTGTEWLAYTWPNVVDVPPKTDVADLHLAHSDDGGTTWTYDGPLWTSQSITNPVTSAVNLSSAEVISLAPGDGAWFEVHLAYAVVPGEAPEAQTSSWTFHASTAATPAALPAAPAQVLGFGQTDPAWQPDVTLDALSPDVASCARFNEPALLYRDHTLYLAAQCIVDDTGVSDFYAVFATSAQGAATAWTWRYVGKLADHADAEAEGGHVHWVELDLTTAVDGTLLATFTPADPNAHLLDVHFGCRVIEVASIDPPALARAADGSVIERAIITASDLATWGPGACGYEPSSTTGVLLTRKLVADPVEGYEWSLNATGLRP